MKNTIIIMVLLNLFLACLFVAKTRPTEQSVAVPVDPKFVSMIWWISAGIFALNALIFMVTLPKM